MPEGKHYGKSLGLEPSLRAGSLNVCGIMSCKASDSVEPA